MARNTATTMSGNLDDIAANLSAAHGIIDLIFTLDATGDLEGVCEGTLSASLGEVLGRIDAAQGALFMEIQECGEMRRALQAALVVVSGCNADGAFNEQEQTIRAALAKAEGGAA